jgi:thiosulfate/3-mercaptopyruvate sulfurtransferase
MAIAEGYVRPELLAEPDLLWERRDDPKLRIIDCASLDRYERAHIPGAVGLPVDGWLKDPEDKLHVMGPKAFAELMEKLGVSEDTTVVAYDDNQMVLATRLWWVLSHYGHTNAKVLNGVWYRWISEGRPVTFKETVPATGRFTSRPDESVICRLDYLRSNLNASGTQVLDVRPDGEWSGKTNDFGNKRTGHVPGGLHLFAQKFLTDDERRMVRPAPELRTLLKDAGVHPGQEVIVHCQAGIRTTLGMFVLRLMGWDRVRAYDAAMAEWANREDTPLVAESESAAPNP